MTSARRWVLSALLVAVASLVIMTERLDHALGSLIATKQATGQWHDLQTSDLVMWWAVVLAAIAFGTALARESINSSLPAGKWQRPTAWILLYAWIAWILSGALSISCGGFAGFVRSAQDDGRIGIAILIVVILVAVGNRLDVNAGATWKVAVPVRAHLFVLGLLFGFVYLLPMTAGQAADVFRTWGDSNSAEPAFALAAALLLGEMIRESGLRMVRASGASLALTQDAEPDREGRRAFRFLAAVPTGILFVGAVSAGADSVLLNGPLDAPIKRSCVAAIACGVVLTVLLRTVVSSVPPSGPPPAPAPDAPAAEPARVPWLTPTFLVSGACVMAIVIAVDRSFVSALAVLLVLALLGFVEWQRRSGWIDRPIPYGGPLAVAGAAAVAVGVAVYWDPIDVSRGIGVAGVALSAAAGLLGALHVAVRYLGFKLPWLNIRLPVVSILVGWTALSAVSLAPVTLHQARVVAAGGPRTTIGVAVGQWLDRERAASGPDEKILPLLLVGASGGGSKAAYWTDLVLDCAVGGGPLSDEGTEKSECSSDRSAARRARGVFLTSSVSGGSVGVAHYVEHLASVEDGAQWVDGSSGRDFLSPIVAWGLFHDLPLMLVAPVLRGSALLGHDVTPADPQSCGRSDWGCRYNLDRAAVQENAIAGRAWNAGPRASQALTKLWQTSISAGSKTATPVTVFNSALAGSRGRVLVSPLDLAPTSVIDERCPPRSRPGEVVTDAVDAPDMLDPADPRHFDFDITTAALLSGRFPVVDPPARIGRAGGVEPEPAANAPCIPPQTRTLPAVFVRDGGYVENTGLLTIVELLPAIKRAVHAWQARNPGAPEVVVWTLAIDDDPIDLARPARPGAERPKPSSIATKAGPDNMVTSLARETLLSHRAPVECYLRISPDLRVGAHAATGWELSKTTRAHDLIVSVGAGSDNNGKAIEAVQAFLSGHPLTQRIGGKDVRSCPGPETIAQ